MGDNEFKENDSIEEGKGKKYSRGEEVVDELIRILEILKRYNFDMSKLPRGAGKTLGMIKDISEIIKQEELNPEYDIGLVIKRVTLTMRDSKRENSKWTPLKISKEKIKYLEELGLTANRPKKKIKKPKKEDRRKFSKEPFATEELIGILKILQEEGVKIEELPRSSKKLGEIESIAEIVKKRELNPEYNIGRKILNVALSMRLSDEHSLRRLPFSITQQQRKVLEDMGITARMVKKERKLKDRKQRDDSVDYFINILNILKNHGINILKLPRDSKKLKDFESLSEVIKMEELNPEYNIGLMMKNFTRTIRVIEENSKGTKAYRITEEQLAILKKLGVTGRKTKISGIKKVEKHNQYQGKSGKIKRTQRKSASDQLIEILGTLEKHIPGISTRLPKARIRLEDIEEIQEIIEREGISKDAIIEIGGTVTKAKRAVLNLYVDRVISTSTIDKLKEYGLLTDEQIEEYRKIQELKAKGKEKTKAQTLIEVLQILKNHGVDILNLPRSNKKIGEIEYLKEIVAKNEIDKDYDIGQSMGMVIDSIKETLSGKRSRCVVSDEEIKTLRGWGFVTDWDLEKYQKQITAVQELIIISNKLKNRGIDLRSLLHYECEIGEIDDIEGLKEIIDEERIEAKYKIGKAMRYAENAAKSKILEQENQQYKEAKKRTMQLITDEEIEQLRELGIITEEVMQKYRKLQIGKLQSSSEQDENSTDEAITKIMQVAVAKCVGENTETRSGLEKLSKANQTIPSKE